MEIFVNTVTGKRIPIQLNASDTLDSIKSKIVPIEGTPIDSQELLLKLKPDRTLAEYNIRKGDILHLSPNDLEICIKTPSGKRLILGVNHTDTIRDVKEKIEAKEGTPQRFQVLFDGPKYLQDYQSLGAYDIENGDTLHMVQNGLQISIIDNSKTHDQILTMDVHQKDTIAEVKEQIEEEEGILSMNQQLFFDGSQLEDEQTLKHYGIKNGTILRLYELQLFVKTPTGKTITLQMNRTDLISTLMHEISVKEDFPYSKQRIIFGGRQLAENRTLLSYNIQNESTLHLVLRFSGGPCIVCSERQAERKRRAVAKALPCKQTLSDWN